MTLLAIGLIIFLGLHSIRVFAEGMRTQLVASLGANGWKGVFSIISIVGFILIIYGFGDTRVAPVAVWSPPTWTRHLAALLTLPAFVMIAAAYVPGTIIKAKLNHPMVLGVKLWALAHLLANGNLADIVLFGAFLVWAVIVFRASRQRDRALGMVYTSVGLSRDAIAVAIGIGAWLVFALVLHLHWIGVRAFGLSLMLFEIFSNLLSG